MEDIDFESTLDIIITNAKNTTTPREYVSDLNELISDINKYVSHGGWSFGKHYDYLYSVYNTIFDTEFLQNKYPNIIYYLARTELYQLLIDKNLIQNNEMISNIISGTYLSNQNTPYCFSYIVTEHQSVMLINCVMYNTKNHNMVIKFMIEEEDDILLECLVEYVMKHNIQLTQEIFDKCINHLPYTCTFLEYMLMNGFKLSSRDFTILCASVNYNNMKKIMEHITFPLTHDHFMTIINLRNDDKSLRLQLLLDNGYIMNKNNLLNTIEKSCDILNPSQYILDLIDQQVVTKCISTKFYPNYIVPYLGEQLFQQLIANDDITGVKKLYEKKHIIPTKQNMMTSAKLSKSDMYEYLSLKGGITDMQVLGDNLKNKKLFVRKLAHNYQKDRDQHLVQINKTFTQLHNIILKYKDQISENDNKYVDDITKHFYKIMDMNNYKIPIPLSLEEIEKQKEPIKKTRGRKKIIK